MREIITVSLPPKCKSVLKQKVKVLGFADVSSYLRFLIEQDDNLIPEKELLKNIRAAQKEYASGKAIKAESLVDLL